MNLRRETEDARVEVSAAGRDPEASHGVRSPGTPAEVTISLKTAGTTLIDPQMATFLLPEAKEGMLEEASEELSFLLEGRLHTRDGQILVNSLAEGWAEGTIRFRAEAGRITAAPMGAGGLLDLSPTLAGQANTFLERTNRQFADDGLEVVSVSADFKTGRIKIVTARKP